MDKSLGSIKSVLDAARDKFYLEEMAKAKAKASKDPEKSGSQKIVASLEKDSESSTREVQKGVSMEKSASSAESLSRRSVKKGKKVSRKSGDPKALSSEEVPPPKEVARPTPSQEVARHEPLETVDELSTRGGEEGNPANLLSLNISEEVVSFNKIPPSDDAASHPLEKKADSRSPSRSSGEGPLKKRKIEADPLPVRSVEAAEDIEVVDSGVGEKHQSPVADVGDRHQEVLITNVATLDQTPDDVAAADARTATSTEIEELPADVIADLNKEIVDHPLQPLNSFPPTNLIIISEENPAAIERQEISYEEFQTFRLEMAGLKEQVVRLQGDLVDVNRELERVNKELERVKAPEGRKSEDFMNGAICLLQKFVRKGLVPPEEAMNPSLWN